MATKGELQAALKQARDFNDITRVITTILDGHPDEWKWSFQIETPLTDWQKPEGRVKNITLFFHRKGLKESVNKQRGSRQR